MPFFTGDKIILSDGTEAVFVGYDEDFGLPVIEMPDKVIIGMHPSLIEDGRDDRDH